MDLASGVGPAYNPTLVCERLTAIQAGLPSTYLTPYGTAAVARSPAPLVCGCFIIPHRVIHQTEHLAS